MNSLFLLVQSPVEAVRKIKPESRIRDVTNEDGALPLQRLHPYRDNATAKTLLTYLLTYLTYLLIRQLLGSQALIIIEINYRIIIPKFID